MTLIEFAQWCDDMAREGMTAELALHELASSARDYRAQTRSELIALHDVAALARDRTAAELAARGHE